jgi:formylglycine-generating enzyme required for sulfatase activity
MNDIFICYSKADRDIANQLVQRFKNEGWSVFIDTNTHVGRRWHKEIEKELHSAKAVVVLWSAKSRDSDYVLEEAEYGKRKDILFPALIESVEFPYGFGRIQTADLVGWKGSQEHAGLTELLNSLWSHLNGHASEPVAKTQPQSEQPVTTLFSTPGQTFRDKLKAGGEGPLMVIIPAGRFMMGSPTDEPERRKSEGPQHEVQIAEPFAMGVHAVTFDDYDYFCKNTQREKPGDEGWRREKRPVINVSWKDARNYCAWLSEQTERNYRLPSEAAWEYACRAGTDSPFYTGARITTDQANFYGTHTHNGSAKGEYRKQTVPAGSFPANDFGLYDMHGNVWEWCQDAWHENYQGAPTDGSPWEDGGSEARVVRGGSWRNDPDDVRSSARHGFHPSLSDLNLGFRVYCSSPIE